MTDIEALCERVIMLDEGKIIYDGSLQRLKQNWGEGKQIHFQFRDIVPKEELMLLVDATWEQGEDRYSWIAHVRATDMAHVIGKVVSSYELKDIHIREVSTEEIIRNIYEEGIHHG